MIYTKNYFKKNLLLSGLNQQALEYLEHYGEMSLYKRHSDVYVAHDPSDRVFFVREGRVKLTRSSSDGRELILDILIPGEMFGDLALCGERRRNQSAVALDDTLVCAFKRQDFIEVMYNSPSLASYLLCQSGLRRNETELRLEHLMFLTVEQRLLLTLLKQADRHGDQQQDGSVTVYLIQKDIALLAGAARETVADLLSVYRKKRLIETGYRSLRLLSPKKLLEVLPGEIVLDELCWMPLPSSSSSPIKPGEKK